MRMYLKVDVPTSGTLDGPISNLSQIVIVITIFQIILWSKVWGEVCAYK